MKSLIHPQYQYYPHDSALLTEHPKDTVDHTQFDAKFLLAEGPTCEASFAQLEIRQEREKWRIIEYALRTSKSIMQSAQRIGMKSSLNTLITRFGIREEFPGNRDHSSNYYRNSNYSL